MDLELVKDYFFQRSNYKKEHGFDSYSQNADDVIYHYMEKYPELNIRYKRSRPLSLQVFSIIKKRINEVSIDVFCKEFKITQPFELFIMAFIAGFQGNNINSINYLVKSINKLTDDTTPSAINKIFIQLQIAQLYKRNEQFVYSFKILSGVYKAIRNDEKLMDIINNFFASCCVSLGLLCYYKFNNKTLAGALFYRSILTRLKYEKRYDPLIFMNYISSAYRYAGLTYFVIKSDAYYFLKEAYKMRLDLVNKCNDNYTKEEFVFLSFDYLFFLIQNNYKVDLINSVANRLYKNIILLSPKSQSKMFDDIVRFAIVLAKYYYYLNSFCKFMKWYSLAKYFKAKFNDSFDVSFLESEFIYKSLTIN